MTEAAVFVHRPPSANRTVGVDRYPAEILEMFGDLALVRIKRIDPRKLCPRSGAKRVVRLPIRLSLTEPSILSINPDDVKKSKCYLAGFQSSPNVKDFAKENQVVKIPIEFTNVDGETLNAQVQNNLTACWEDAGLPVLCELSKPLGLTQVGVLRHLVAPENPESQKRFKRAKDTKDKEDEKETTTTASPTRNKGKSSKGSNKDDDEQATTPHAVTKKFEETSAEKSKVEKDDKKNKKTNKKQPSQKAEKKTDDDRDDEDDEKPKLDILFGEMCSNVEEMVFVPLFQPEQLAKLIQKYDLPSFADVYQHCDFS